MQIHEVSTDSLRKHKHTRFIYKQLWSVQSKTCFYNYREKLWPLENAIPYIETHFG